MTKLKHRLSRGRPSARTRAGDAARDAQERMAELSGEARERSRHLADDTRQRAQELGSQARDRAGDLVVRAEPLGAEAAQSVGDLVRAIVRAVALVPALLARVLTVGTDLVGRVAEEGRTVASRVEPPASVRRRRRGRTAAWVGGGFAVGFAAGWVVHDRMTEHEDEDAVEGAVEGDEIATPEGDADVIRARRRSDRDAG